SHTTIHYTDPARTQISTLPLPDALPISKKNRVSRQTAGEARKFGTELIQLGIENIPLFVAQDTALARMRIQTAHADARCRSSQRDRKSTRLNSSHVKISYAVFCLKKKIR